MTNVFQLHRDVRAADASGPASAGAAQPAPGSNSDFSRIDLADIVAEGVHLKPESRLIFHSDPRSCAADRYRFLRMKLRELWTAGKLKSLLITSPLPEDGKSTTALNVASALSDHGKCSVLLIEADLYHSPLVEMLGIEPGPGLAECLESGLDPRSAIRRLQPLGWYLLPAGKPQGNPTELLQTEVFANTIQRLISCFDWVLIDSPPVVPLVDALLLKRHANATLLVARAGHTPREAIERSVTLIGRDHILGVVLNAVEGLNAVYSKYSNYYLSGSSGARK